MARFLLALLATTAGAAASNCTGQPLPYRIDVCDLFHPPKNASMAKSGTVAARAPGLHGAALGRLGALVDARLKALAFSVEVVPGARDASITVDASASAIRVDVAAAAADGADADALADALAAASPASLRAAVVRNEPFKCVGCIVERAFLDLAVANFGLADVACEVCSCASLSEAACVEVIQAALYAAIAAMPAIAVAIFDACEGYCESGRARDLPAPAIPASDLPSLAIPACGAGAATFGAFAVSNAAGSVAPRQATSGTACYDDAGLHLSTAADDDDVFSGAATACDSPVFVKSDALEVFIAPVRDERDDPTWYFELDAAPSGTMWGGLSNNSKGDTAYCVDERNCAAAGPLPCNGTNAFAHGMTVATTATARGWRADLFVPWGIFADEFRPAGGHPWPHWRLNVYRYDYPDGPDAPFELTAWSPTHDASFHVPARFGRATLVE